MEELWAFNEEIVARSIYKSKIPIISAVGHEIDFTIADFVSDMRAETPTAAAEAAVPDIKALYEYVAAQKTELCRNLRSICENRKNRLERLNPESFGRDIQSRIVFEQMRIENLIGGMKETLNSKLTEYRNDIELFKSHIEASDPRAILAKGYSVVTDDKGNIIKYASDMTENQHINIEMAAGRAGARVTAVDTEKR